MYTVADIMTRDPVALDAADDLALANAIFQFGRFRHLPVMRGGKLAGLLSHRDYLRGLARANRTGEAVLARDVMSSPVERVKPDTSLARALRLMVRKKYGCLPVVDERRRLVGIVTETDATRLAARLVRDLDEVMDISR